VRSTSQSANDEFLSFTGSVHFDSRLWKYDIAGSIAHAHALTQAGVLSKKELREMTEGLRSIAKDIGVGRATFDPALEDIHMNIEKMLIDRIGETGRKLHTGRSRNDQVALDMRLLVRESVASIIAETLRLQETLLSRAEQNKGAILPGYTHLQHAQPVLLSHHLLAHLWRLQRDISRLSECYTRANISPLGSGALAGTAFGIDRSVPAEMLRMRGVTENSMDAVSDRDFVAESAFAMCLIMIHLSSLCEELIVWSSQEFGFLKVPKDLSSGSSMMPQKRNPDIPELVRGKSGRAVGDLVAILTVLKSLPLAYNRDLQEDKENLFDVFDTVGVSLHALTSFLAEADFDTGRMRKAAEAGLMTATDLADFLTMNGMPFRTAHAIVSEAAASSPKDDAELVANLLRILSERGDHVDVSRVKRVSLEDSVGRRNSEGGTANSALVVQVARARAAMKRNLTLLNGMREDTRSTDDLLS
jgi:argininosuccinate lyase